MGPDVLGSDESHEAEQKSAYLLRRQSSSGNGHQSSSGNDHHSHSHEPMPYPDYPIPAAVSNRDSRVYSNMPGLSSAEWLGGQNRRASGSGPTPSLRRPPSGGLAQYQPDAVARASPTAASFGAPSSVSNYYTPRGPSPSHSQSAGHGSSEQGHRSGSGSEEAIPRQKSNVPPTSFLFRPKTSESLPSESGSTKGIFGRIRNRSRTRTNSRESESADSHAPSTFRELASQSTPTVHRRSPSPSSQSPGLWAYPRPKHSPASTSNPTPALPDLILQEEQNKHRAQRAQDGLLNPQLAWRRTMGLRQDSSTSLGDHEDYSRPIGGVCNFHSEH